MRDEGNIRKLRSASGLINEAPLAMLHLVARADLTSAGLAEDIFVQGHPVETYSSVAELLDRPPRWGAILVHQDRLGGSPGALLERLDEASIWLPVIVAAENPQTDQIVAAIRCGVLDYVDLPIEAQRLRLLLARVMAEAEDHAEARRQQDEARRRVNMLSKREREVFELLVQGCVNKIVARKLGISPRTVEIYRASMKRKLGAAHAAELSALWMQSRLHRSPHLGAPCRHDGTRWPQMPR